MINATQVSGVRYLAKMFLVHETWGVKPESNLSHVDLNHVDLNHGSEKELPWNLEQSVLPESTGYIYVAQLLV